MVTTVLWLEKICEVSTKNLEANFIEQIFLLGRLMHLLEKALCDLKNCWGPQNGPTKKAILAVKNTGTGTQFFGPWDNRLACQVEKIPQKRGGGAG